MFRNLMNGVSLSAMMLRDAENGQGSVDEKAKLREAIAKGTNVTVKSDNEKPEADAEGDDEDEDNDDDQTADEDDEDDEDGEKEEEKKVEETPEQKAAREASETAADKEKRKQERIQKRIDKAVAAQRTAEERVAVLEAQLKADPDKTLTEEEVQKRAKVIADEAVAAKELENLQKEFNKACDKLQDAATKLDKEFTPKVVAMADELGPIPSRVIGILDDLDNGAEVLKFMVDDIDEAEKIYDLKDRPEKLAIALVRISDKLAAAKKPKPKQISKVPDPVKPVNGGNVQSLAITEADTKDMDKYIAKRRRQEEEKRKARGY